MFLCGFRSYSGVWELGLSPCRQAYVPIWGLEWGFTSYGEVIVGLVYVPVWGFYRVIKGFSS